jgi:Zn-dependent metalloprotease
LLYELRLEGVSMATISSLSGAQSAAQSGLRQLRLQQAKRDAEQAEQIARALQAQAQSAQQHATEAMERARAITSQSDQAQATAGQARQGLAAVSAVVRMQNQLSGVVTQVTERMAPPKPAPATKSSPTPVVNAEGQVTGAVVNTTA